MAFKLNPTRKFTVKYEDKQTKDSFEADFEFILTEDCFTEEIRKRSQDMEPILDSDSDEIKEKKIFKAQSLVWYKIRKSLVSVRGINDMDGNPIEINDDTRDAVFEFIANCGDVATQVLSAFMGFNPKNLNAGVTQ